MLSIRLAIGAGCLTALGYGQSSSSPAVWPEVLLPVQQNLNGKFRIERDSKVPSVTPSITSEQKKNSVVIQSAKDVFEGDVFVDPKGAWTRFRWNESPGDNYEVLGRSDPFTTFQLDPRDELKFESTGWKYEAGYTAFFIGEGFGWSPFSISGGPGGPDWKGVLSRFKVVSRTRQGNVEKTIGTSEDGVRVEVETDAEGRKLREIVIEETSSSVKMSRRTRFTKWQEIKNVFVPVEGTFSFSLEFPQAGTTGKDIETQESSFKITNLRSVESASAPPWKDGMVFRAMKPGQPHQTFRRVNGKYIPIEDPGNIEKASGSAVGVYILSGTLGLGCLGLVRSRYRKRSIANDSGQS